MGIQEIETIIDSLNNTFNLNYDALGALLSNNINNQEAISKIISAMKKTLDLMLIFKDLCLDADLKTIIENNYYTKLDLLNKAEKELANRSVNVDSPTQSYSL